jgi:hypothetical protein
MVNPRDIRAFGFPRAERMAQDRENERYMIPLNTKDRGTPYQPIGPSQGVRRGATWPGCSEFIARSMERARRLT